MEKNGVTKNGDFESVLKMALFGNMNDLLTLNVIVNKHTAALKMKLSFVMRSEYVFV